METISWQDFEKVDLRVGTIVEAYLAEGLNKPSIRLVIDFGDLGIRNSSAQLTRRYSPEELRGRKVIAVVNFPPKQIGKFISECLVLGAIDGSGDVALLSTENDVKNGSRIA